MISRPTVDEAFDSILRFAPSLRDQACQTADALGRVLSADVAAERSHPAFDMSAMDGFAIRHDDISFLRDAPRPLLIDEPVFAGGPSRAIPTGNALPISTGARVPTNCGAVLIREHAVIDKGRLILTDPLSEGSNIRRCGEDAAAGERVLAASTLITAGVIGTLLCYGVRTVPVKVTPRATILPTGDELLAAPSDPASIFDANGPMVRACLSAFGVDARLENAVSDEPSTLERRIRAAMDAGENDLIITTGGVSAGTRDQVSQVVQRLGARIHFHGVQMRPGKPILFATLPTGQLFFGLPGNPVAALVGCRFFIGAAIRAMLGRPGEAGLHVTLPSDAGRKGTTVFLKACSGAPGFPPDLLPGQQSHMMRPLLYADAWLRIDSYTEPVARLYPLSGSL